ESVSLSAPGSANRSRWGCARPSRSPYHTGLVPFRNWNWSVARQWDKRVGWGTVRDGLVGEEGLRCCHSQPGPISVRDRPNDTNARSFPKRDHPRPKRWIVRASGGKVHILIALRWPSISKFEK